MKFEKEKKSFLARNFSKFCLLILFYGCCLSGFTQNHTLTNSFTTANGLPSNNIYAVCEDKDGFLWIGTDNGVSRFDGKNFINYSIADGLPSADAIIIEADLNGTIWVNCYRQPPSYFDVEKNAFVCIDFNEVIRKISTELLFSQLQNDGTLVFQNNLGFFQLNKKKILAVKGYNTIWPMLTFPINNDRKNISRVEFSKDGKDVFRFEIRNGNKPIGVVQLEQTRAFRWQLPHDDFIYLAGLNEMYSIYDFSTKPFKYKRSRVTFPENIASFKTNGSRVNIISRENTLFVCDKKTLKIETKIHIGVKTNSAFYDSKKRIWVATIGDGLLFYSNSTIQKLNSTELNENFISITKTAKDGILLGGHDGKITHYSKGQVKNFNVSNGISDQSVIKNIKVGKDVFTITSDDFHVNYADQMGLGNNTRTFGFKSAARLNKNTIAIGAIANLFALNTETSVLEKMIPSNKLQGRIIKILRNDDSSFYFIDNNGVFLFSIKDKKIHSLIANTDLTNGAATEIHIDESKNVWIGTTKGYVYLLKAGTKNTARMKKLYISDNILQLFAKNNRLWIATKSGLYVVDYSNKTKWKKHKLSEFDGLSSIVINDFSYNRDTLYLATTNGVTLVPTDMEFNKFEIKPHLISVSVDGKVIGNGSAYTLKQGQSKVLVHLAGIDLSGHFDKFQYALNDKNNWSNLSGNFLNLSLNNGENKVFIRAVDVNGKVSSQQLILAFYLESPFYLKGWFILLIGVLGSFLVLNYFSRRKLRRQKIIFDKQIALEHQRNKITADLHDDIGATLSSLQINSSVVLKLMDEQPSRAKEVLQKIENQSYDLADKIGDIIWSMKPGEDEFMTLSSRIKNFANDILSATNMTYKIQIDPAIDKAFTDISLRKNIVLIVKEAINNAAKYSKGTHLFVRLMLKDSFVHIKIQDDGVGFVLGEKVGNGIKNMETRVKDLSGTFTIISQPNNGTTISAVLPCP